MDDRLTAGLAASLALHGDCDAALLDQARLEIRRRGRYHEDEDASAEVEKILQQAQAQAALIRTSQDQSSKEDTVSGGAGATSFSLFAFVGGSSSLLLNAPLAAYCSWEAMQEEATTVKETLTLLQKVEYADDMLPDWETGVRPFLRQALEDDDHDDELPSCDDAVHLHRKWYQLTRGSGSIEYQAMQLDLLENLVSQQTSSLKESSIKLRIETSLDIFADIVDRGIVKNQKRCNEIGTLLWTRLLSPPSSTSNVWQMIIDHDPHAVGLSKWIIGCLTSEEVVSLLTMKVLGQDGTPASTSILERLLKSANDCDEQLFSACFSASILRSALVTTRVSGFPWHLAVAQTDLAAAPQTAIAGTYVRLIYRILENKKSPSLLREWDALIMCVDALDTILCGCPQEEPTGEALRKLVLEVKDRLKTIMYHPLTDPTFRLLERVVQ